MAAPAAEGYNRIMPIPEPGADARGLPLGSADAENDGRAAAMGLSGRRGHDFRTDRSSRGTRRARRRLRPAPHPRDRRSASGHRSRACSRAGPGLPAAAKMKQPVSIAPRTQQRMPMRLASLGGWKSGRHGEETRRRFRPAPGYSAGKTPRRSRWSARCGPPRQGPRSPAGLARLVIGRFAVALAAGQIDVETYGSCRSTRARRRQALSGTSD